MSKLRKYFKHLVVTSIFGMALSLSGEATSFAVVNVDSVNLSGAGSSYSNGADVTIVGRGFGPNGPNVVLFDDFELGSDGAPPLTGPGSAQVGQWASASKKDTTGFSSLSAVSGNLAYQSRVNTWSADSGTYSSFIEALLPVNTTKVFVSWWIYLPSGDNFPGQTSNRINWKQMWIQGAGTTDDDLVVPTFLGSAANTLNNFLVNGNDALQYGKYLPMTFTRGVWTRLSVWLDAVPGGDGKVHFWQVSSSGAKQLLSDNAARFLKAGGAYERVRVNGYSDNATPNSRPTFDDVYIASGPYARARVEVGNSSAYSNCTKLSVITTKTWNDGQITGTFRQGSFKQGDSAFLYVFDSNGEVNANGFPITIGATSGGGSTPPSPVDNTPSLAISTPTSGSTFTTSNSLVTIAGSASDDKGIASVTWSSTLGGSGTATNLNGTWSSWQIANLALSQGNNPITVTVTDTAGQKTSKTLTLSYSTVAQTPPPPSGTKVWDAVSQNGDSAWKSSSVTYTVRLLVKGSVLTQGGNQVSLGFQGRSTGDYTIRKVSIAQRDLNGGVGDVVDSTWSRVTFDGKTSATWGTDAITVPAGQEKFSDPIPFPLMAGQDYYVTFKIDSPSVYLNPPSGYQELYFQNTDRTDDVDWSGNGHAVTQDYHALGSILAEGAAPVRLTAPKGVRMVQAN